MTTLIYRGVAYSMEEEHRAFEEWWRWVHRPGLWLKYRGQNTAPVKLTRAAGRKCSLKATPKALVMAEGFPEGRQSFVAIDDQLVRPVPCLTTVGASTRPRVPMACEATESLVVPTLTRMLDKESLNSPF